MSLEAHTESRATDRRLFIWAPVVASVGWLVICIFMEAGEWRLFREVGISFAAGWLVGATAVIPYLCAYWAGTKTAAKAGENWTGWLVGIAAFLVVGGTLYILAGELPVVGKRFEQFTADVGP